MAAVQPIEKFGRLKKADLAGVFDGGSALRLLISNGDDEGALVVIRQYRAYRVSDEGDRLRLINEMASSDRSALIYQDTSGELNQWLYSEAERISPVREDHFLVVTRNLLVDVLTPFEPEVFRVAAAELREVIAVADSAMTRLSVSGGV